MPDQIPSTMRAAVLVGRGGPDQLVVRDDVAVPSPDDDEVLIRVAACGVNNTDINTRVGWYDKGESGDAGSDDEVGGWSGTPMSSRRGRMPGS